MVDWGSVPDWVGSVGTAGALILGFTVLLREQTARARDQATRITLWREWVGSHDRPPVYHLYNASDRPIVDIGFEFQNKVHDIEFGSFEPAAELLPQGRITFQGDEDWDGPSAFGHVTFTDATGQRWRLDEKAQLKKARRESEAEA